jgi:hypothetical protein
MKIQVSCSIFKLNLASLVSFYDIRVMGRNGLHSQSSHLWHVRNLEIDHCKGGP